MGLEGTIAIGFGRTVHRWGLTAIFQAILDAQLVPPMRDPSESLFVWA
jgi:hypothetical protein